MSMISEQCDELRDAADELDERTKAYGPSGRNVISPLLRRAADTIWELRCKLADVVDQSEEIERLKAENAKLRDAMYTNAGKHALQHMDEDELRIWATQQSEYIEELRELLSMYMTFARAMACDYVFQIAHPDGMGKVMDEAEMRKRAMELGIEWCR